eukprot:scaffold4845_cov62-Phaeocystis_antarctica.AAC.7
MGVKTADATPRANRGTICCCHIATRWPHCSMRAPRPEPFGPPRTVPSSHPALPSPRGQPWPRQPLACTRAAVPALWCTWPVELATPAPDPLPGVHARVRATPALRTVPRSPQTVAAAARGMQSEPLPQLALTSRALPHAALAARLRSQQRSLAAPYCQALAQPLAVPQSRPSLACAPPTAAARHSLGFDAVEARSCVAPSSERRILPRKGLACCTLRRLLLASVAPNWSASANPRLCREPATLGSRAAWALLPAASAASACTTCTAAAGPS